MRKIEIIEACADCEADDHGCVDAVISVAVREKIRHACFGKTVHVGTLKLISDEDDASGAYISDDCSWIKEEYEDADLLIRTALNAAVDEENEGRCLDYLEGKRLHLNLANISQKVLERMM